MIQKVEKVDEEGLLSAESIQSIYPFLICFPALYRLQDMTVEVCRS